MASDYSSARKEPIGWKHILNVKWDGTLTDWAERVVRWGVISWSMSQGFSGSAVAGGVTQLRLADTDRVLWGSFKGAAGTEPLWTTIEFDSKLGGPDGTFSFPVGTTNAVFGRFRFGEMAFGDLIFTGKLTKGRTLEFIAQENEVGFQLFDDITTLAKAKFIFDYTNLATTIGGNVYGTVRKILSPQMIAIEESGNQELREYLNNLRHSWYEPYLHFADRTYTHLQKMGALGSAVIIPGDILKFDGSNVSSVNAGAFLSDHLSYSVSEGTFKVDNMLGSVAILNLSQPLVNVKEGDYVYRRHPLRYTGNPAEIIRQMLIGTNTNVGLPSGSINISFYGAATAACNPMYFDGYIEDESAGAVLNAIKEISTPLDAKYFFDRNGQWCWIPYRPRTTTLDVNADTYDATSNGTGNMVGMVSYREKLSEVYTDVRLRYKYNRLENERFAFKGLIERTNLTAATRYHGYRNLKEIDSRWIHDDNEAVIIAERLLRGHATASQHLEFNTSLYGLESNLYDVLSVTHRTGSLTAAAFQITDIRMDLTNDMINLQLEDISDVWWGKGFGYYENDGTAGGQAVSGTSKSGFSWWDSETLNKHGSIVATIGPATYVLKDVYNNWPSLGSGGVTRYVCVGPELLQCTDAGSRGSPTGTYHFNRGVETTSDQGSLSPGAGWTYIPMDPVGKDIMPIHSGSMTDLGWTPLAGQLARINGTVLNINTGSWGTFFRFF